MRSGTCGIREEIFSFFRQIPSAGADSPLARFDAEKPFLPWAKQFARNEVLMLAGHGGGTIAVGRVIDTGTMPEERQRLCNLHLAPAKRMEVDLDRFGDSVEEMEGLN